MTGSGVGVADGRATWGLSSNRNPPGAYLRPKPSVAKSVSSNHITAVIFSLDLKGFYFKHAYFERPEQCCRR